MSEAAFCAVCGWPVAAAKCEACDTPAGTGPAPGKDDTNLWILGGARPEDFPDLKNAFLAWQAKDWPRMIGQCLVALGMESPTITNLPQGPGWSFTLDSAAVYMSLDKARGELSIESPMVRLPARQRVPLMRALLEMNETALGAPRFCLRGDLVLLRFAEQVVNLAPPKLVGAIRELAIRADQLDDLLSVAFAAPMVGPEAQRQRLPWQILGTPRKLKHLKGADATPLPPPAPVAAAPATTAAVPAIAAGTAVPPSTVDAVEAQLRQADALCELLKGALALARPLDFVKDLHPGVPLLLQRALLFRAFDQFRETCPDAVSLLLRQGEPIYAQFWETPTGGLRALMDNARSAMPSPTVMEAILQHVVQTRAQVGKQPPCVPPAFPSTTEAKTVLRKYLAETEKGPKDLVHRHFVLLGGYSELMTRTRLPEATAARVRQIMASGLERGPVTTPYLIEKLKSIAE